jgi:cytochrome c biogenesis protein CcmG/thiol:disulfide interchange protein DsbE
MRNALFLIAGIVVVTIVVAAYAAGGGRPGAEGGGGGPAMLAGAPAQSFPATRLDGKLGALDDYRGKVVLLNLWASWCTPCREEMPALERLYTEDARRGLVVLGVDQGESTQAAGGFAREHGVTFPILVDEAQRYGRAYAAIGLPTTVVIDRAFHIVHGIDGALTFAQMREAVDPLLRAR